MNEEETFKVPQAIESEKVVLGSILIDGESIKRIAHLLGERGEDFYLQSHRYIYLAMMDLYKSQEAIDIISIFELLNEKGVSADVYGGSSYLAQLASEVTTSTAIVTHAKNVAKRAVLRNMIKASQSIIKMTNESNLTLDEMLEKAEGKIKGVTRESSKIEDKLGMVDLEDWRKIARETEDRDGEVHGISTGIKGFDDMIEGFEPGEVMIVTGHTKHGKSRFAANIAKNVANQGKTVLYINTEMTKLQMGRRFNTMLGDAKLKGKIRLNDKAGLTHVNALQLMEKAKEDGCDMVIIDHLHFFSRSIDNQTNEISKMAKDFKDAAVEMEIPLIMLCHLQQADTKKKPTLQMIKNSSSIAQDADMVIGVWLDDRPDADDNETQILRLAHRSAGGSTKKIVLYNDGMNLKEIKPAPSQQRGQMIHDPNRIIEGRKADDIGDIQW